MKKNPHRIVMLAGRDDFSLFVYNALIREFAIEKLIIEQPASRVAALRRSVGNLGLTRTIGQMLFKICVQHWQQLGSLAYLEELQHRLNLDSRQPDAAALCRVGSANAVETIQLLKELRPALVIVHGTRILSKRLLQSVDAVFINLHTGITPLYRGVHGGYWALAQRDPQHCGVTVQLIEPGSDTGGILRQALIRPSPRDNFTSYPLLQAAAGIDLLKQVIGQFFAGPLETIAPPAGAPRLWPYPTLAQYFYHYFAAGVK